MIIDVPIGLTYVFGAGVLLRAAREGSLARLAFFYSYLIYFLATGLVGLGFQFFIPRYFPHYFWVRFLTLDVAEFALLVQIGDRVFASYSALRRLGRLVTLGITVLFSIAYILPPLLEARPSRIAIYDLVKRSAVTKAIIILLLVALAAYFRVALGRNVAGITVGLMTFLGINIANFALIERLGWARYGGVFGSVGPLSQMLMVLIWLVGLWRYEPAPALRPAVARPDRREAPLPEELGRYNTRLERLLRR